MEQEATEQICTLHHRSPAACSYRPAEKVAAPHLIGAREQTSFPCPELEYSSPTRVRYCSGNVETWAAFAFFLPFETCRVLFGMPLAVSDGLSDSDLAHDTARNQQGSTSTTKCRRRRRKSRFYRPYKEPSGQWRTQKLVKTRAEVTINSNDNI
jgi:hypothetical protein